MPYISLASKLEVNGSVATLDTEIIGGLQIVELELPAVISCAKGMAEQRIPNMRGIMAARTKPLTVVPPSEVDSLTSFVGYSLPDAKTACKMIDPEKYGRISCIITQRSKSYLSRKIWQH